MRRLISAALVFLVTLTCLVALSIPALGEEPTEWELKIPEGVQSIASIDTAPRLNSLEGKTIGLYWNGKPGGDYFFNRLAELLQQRFPTAKIVKFWEVNTATKSFFSGQPVNETPIAWMAKNADLVIGGQCD